MAYQHQYFQLDTESKKVFDENGKELVLTGNAYRMLVFLCDKKHANLSEIGAYLDYAKEYTENHLRQYRYKIETIIGRNVIEYKNGIYSIIGDIQESPELAKIERNTDLLRSEGVELGQKVDCLSRQFTLGRGAYKSYDSKRYELNRNPLVVFLSKK